MPTETLVREGMLPVRAVQVPDPPPPPVQPDPPEIVPIAPFMPVWPMPTIGSDHAIEVYAKARGQVAFVEHKAQCEMVLELIKDAVRDTLVRHKVLDGLERIHRLTPLYELYAERTAKIAHVT